MLNRNNSFAEICQVLFLENTCRDAVSSMSSDKQQQKLSCTHRHSLKKNLIKQEKKLQILLLKASFKSSYSLGIETHDFWNRTNLNTCGILNTG